MRTRTAPKVSVTQMSSPSKVGTPTPTSMDVNLIAPRILGVAQTPTAARRLERLTAESCVLRTKAAIWSRVTAPEGLYAVAEVPLTSPEK